VKKVQKGLEPLLWKLLDLQEIADLETFIDYLVSEAVNTLKYAGRIKGLEWQKSEQIPPPLQLFRPFQHNRSYIPARGQTG